MSKGGLNRSSGDPFGRKPAFVGTLTPQIPRARMISDEETSRDIRSLINALQSSHKEDSQRWNYWTEQLLQETKTLNRTFMELVQQNNLLLTAYVKDVRIAELKAVHWEAHARNAWLLLEAAGAKPPEAVAP